MNVIKTLVFMAILLLLVLMGIHNRGTVDFTFPPLLKGTVQQPAALMYFVFFAVGVLAGTVATFGRRKQGKADK